MIISNMSALFKALSSPLRQIASVIAALLPAKRPKRKIFVDISELVSRDAGSGIQRVVRNVLRCLLLQWQDDFRIEPIYATDDLSYRYARRFTLGFLGYPSDVPEDEFIEPETGDIFLGLDLLPAIVPRQKAIFEDMRARGTKVYFVVYDLLCVRRPEFFPPDAYEGFKSWLDVITSGDGAICISKSVAHDLLKYLEESNLASQRPFRIGHFHLGAEIEEPSNLSIAPDPVDWDSLSAHPSVLMVGTIEPRKGYIQALGAFERLWSDRVDVNLIIVGKPGWMMEEFLVKLREHNELGKRLLLFDRASDHTLSKLYKVASGLLLASEAEGFGLPLIEAARYGIPILARDLPVFREVAGEHATYFTGLDVNDLANSLKRWLNEIKNGTVIQSNGMRTQTWSEATKELLAQLGEDKWYKRHLRKCGELLRSYV